MIPTIEQALKILGFKVRDRVTGFSGVATSVSFDLYGCVQVVLTPPMDKDGKIPEGRWHDYNRLEVLPAEPPAMEAPKFVAFDKGPAEKPLP